MGIRLRVLPALILGCVPIGVARGQVPADTAVLADIVVTGTPVPTRAGAIAAAVTVLSGDELRARGVRLVHDALREVPGLLVVSAGSFGGTTSLFARGGESNYVKVLIDGVPANQPGGGFDFATLSLSNVERIEVVRGPASVVHGSDAVSGVVHVITRRGGGGVRGEASVQAGTFGSLAADAAASGGNEGLGWSAGLGRFSTDGIYEFNSRFESTVASAALGARPDAATTLSATARYDRNSYGFPTDGTGAPVDSNQQSSGSTLTLGGSATRVLGERVEMIASVGVTEIRYDYDDAMDSPGDTSGFGFASRRRSEVGRMGGGIRGLYRAEPSLTVIGGLEVERLRERQTGWASSNFGGGPFTEEQLPFAASRVNGAAFAQVTLDHVIGLAATGGVRHDQDEAFGGFTTVRAGVAWRLPGGPRVRASLGTAFKAPNFSESFADSPFERGDRGLRPERTRSWEVGAEQLLAGGALQLAAAWFDQRFRNLIQYVASEPPAPTYVNLGEATARGLELSASLRPVGAVAFTASYTRLWTEVTEAPGGSLEFLAGGPLLRRPAASARFDASVRLARVAFGAGVTALGARDDIDFTRFERVSLPAHATVDAGGELDLLERAGGRRLALLVHVENALDADYETVVGYPARGRTLFLGVRAGL